MQNLRHIGRLTPQDYRISAGGAQAMLFLAMILELLVAAICVSFGIVRQNSAVFLVGIAALFFALIPLFREKVLLPGALLAAVDKNGICFSGCLGFPVSKNRFAWLKAVQTVELDGSDDWLLLIPNDPNWGGRRAQPMLQREGGILIDIKLLAALSGQEITADELCDAILDHMMLERLSSLPADFSLSSSYRLPNNITVIDAGWEADLCSNGICLRMRGSEEVLLLPFSKLSDIYVFVEQENKKKEIFLLLHIGGEFLSVSDSMPLFSPLYDLISDLDRFDRRAFLSAINHADGTLICCFSK